ncbi:hypothetical protein [Phycicoccus sp. SLBN-51]|uniref:hypothetical protein n=1 Tax=Phycicoccus sp. SLBN-51 TaxID=2768447 RepID=UPI001C93135C|nr:hypothetical protein [Phycicoccus sp. SLBN-51]
MTTCPRSEAGSDQAAVGRGLVGRCVGRGVVGRVLVGRAVGGEVAGVVVLVGGRVPVVLGVLLGLVVDAVDVEGVVDAVPAPPSEP